MATDRMITKDQGDSIITKLDLIATKIQGINRDILIPSSQVNAMTGYAKASAASAIATSDSLNAAIGKLEYKADTNETNISTVTDHIKFDSSSKTYYLQQTQPSSPAEGDIWIG